MLQFLIETASGQGEIIPPWQTPMPGQGGSIVFGENGSPSYVQYTESSSWALGTGDFAISFFAFNQPPRENNFGRVFSVGSNSGNVGFAVSMESGTMYFWGGSQPLLSALVPDSQWVHYAIQREGDTTRLWVNGGLEATTSFEYDVNNVLNGLTLGGEGDHMETGQYYGYLSQLHIVKGGLLQPGADIGWTVPVGNATPITETVLLLNNTGFLVDAGPDEVGTSAEENVGNGYGAYGPFPA